MLGKIVLVFLCSDAWLNSAGISVSDARLNNTVKFFGFRCSVIQSLLHCRHPSESEHAYTRAHVMLGHLGLGLARRLPMLGQALVGTFTLKFVTVKCEIFYV